MNSLRLRGAGPLARREVRGMPDDVLDESFQREVKQRRFTDALDGLRVIVSKSIHFAEEEIDRLEAEALALAPDVLGRPLDDKAFRLPPAVRPWPPRSWPLSAENRVRLERWFGYLDRVRAEA